MEAQTLYEDNDVKAILPKNCITKGEILLIPKEKCVILEQVSKDVISKMFMLANNLSAALFTKLKCHGTNILIQNGIPAGQNVDQFCMRIIPRYENDDIDFEWQRKQADPSELEKIHNKFFNFEKNEKDDKLNAHLKKKAETKKEPFNLNDDEKENYLIKHLDRVA